MNPLLRLGTPVALLLVASSFSSCSKDSAKTDASGGKPRVAKLAGVVAAKSVFTDPVSGLGSVGAPERVSLRSEVAGKVRDVAVRDGAAVRRGQILVQLEDDEAKAVRDRAAARARLAAATLARVREQLRVEAASSQQVEVAAADSAVARAELAIAEVALERTRLRAPFDGVAGLSDVSRGQWITAGQVLTEVVSGAKLRIDWSVPERLASSVRTGMPLTWKDPGTGAVGTAVVEALDPTLSESTRSRRMRASCRTRCDVLLPGSGLELRLAGDTVPVVSLPSQVLSGNAAGLAVFVMREGKAVLVPVVAGRRSIDRIEIVSGVAVGDTVLVPGAAPPKPGSPVEIARLLGGSEKPGPGAADAKPGQAAGTRP
jgi:membrane fusion protein (multidrug efflux system)